MLLGERKMDFKKYKDLMERQIETGDFRERVFQDNIIRPFLQSLFPELDIEPVDVKTATKKHQYEQYCGYDFVDGKKIIGTPDLCIAEKWFWENKKRSVTYRGIVEIKSPLLDGITGREPENYKTHTLDEIRCYLNATKNSKIILTDGLTWTFYDKGEYNTPKQITIGKIDVNYRKIKGYKNRLVNEKDDAGDPIIEKIKIELKKEEFGDLQEELRNFICGINKTQK